MQLTLFKKDSIKSSVLPDKHSGQYWVTHDIDGVSERLVSIDGYDDKWVLKSNKNVSILDSKGNIVKELTIEPLCFYPLRLRNSSERVLLYSEPITPDRSCFQKLLVPAQGKLTIGRAENCDICFNNNFTSSLHAEIAIKDEELMLKDLNSSNGTFLNGTGVTSRKLAPGDFVYIMGLKIIIGKGFIAINNPDGKVTYNKSVLRRYVSQSIETLQDSDEDTAAGKDETFYRSPRFKKEIELYELKIDPPPALGNLDEVPLTLLLGPTLTMGLTSLFTALLTLENVRRNKGDMMAAMPTLAMAFSMLLGTVLWPILTKRYEAQKRRKREALRQKSYRQYIDGIRQEIKDVGIRQSEILNANHINANSCISRIQNRERNLWERSKGQNDFLTVRLGVGNIPLNINIGCPERKFTLDCDNLVEELYNLVNEPKVLKNVPVTLSLLNRYIVGIIGDRSKVASLVKNIIIQLTALHSYDELKLVFIYNPKEQAQWKFVRWLPHVWGKDSAIRFVATNSNEVKEISAYIEKEISERNQINSEDALKDIIPHYVIFSMDKELSQKTEMIASILKHKTNHGFSFVALYDELNQLPKECSMIIEIDEGKSRLYDKNDITGKFTMFQPDEELSCNIEDVAISLANIKLDTSTKAYTLPSMLTFLDMFGVGRVEHLNILSRWKENDPTKTLETPIGVDSSGDLFKLDVHEKFHGPHGLIAGTTGSGKSELIMTYILSLAINYHPHEVAFILIDYKGGGMANTFARLPHLVGTITNLDGAAVKRSLVTIQSELKRRQKIFSEASKKVGVSNIDIYAYQKLYRDGLVDEFLQHLFIISDEFAELKAQQPEFMTQLVSASRIGRSLGVHLIPATQKPSGVVDDQIWSNTKFRICLKVQDKADSMDVLKKPDAAELKGSGRFYVQVGNDELFELGQSAWGGAPYYPSDRVEQKQITAVEVVDSLGRVIKQAKMSKVKNQASNPPKQIDEIVNYISKLSKEEAIRVNPLWLEPMAPVIYLNTLDTYEDNKKFTLNPAVGMVDDPENQRQFTMKVPITSGGNVLIYGAADSGKTTFVSTLIYSLTKNHTPEELSLYVLDFGAETLRSFAKLPHVGGVVISSETEKINNLLKMLLKELAARKKLFAEYGGDYQSYIRNSNQRVESIVVIIHNYAIFNELFGEKEEIIAYLTREGTKYGIYFVLTVLNSNGVRYKVGQNFKQSYVLQLNDNTEYSLIVGNTGGMYPSKFKGRGIYKADKLYEFQIAHISSDEAENRFDYIRKYCEDYAKTWKGKTAKRIATLPRKVDINFLEEELNTGEVNIVPIGIDKNSLNIEYYNFDNTFINLALSQSNDTVGFAQGLAEALSVKNRGVIVIDPETVFKTDINKKYDYICGEDNLSAGIVSLFNILVDRHSKYKNAKENNEETPAFDKLTCIITSLSGLYTNISEDSKSKLDALLLKGSKLLNVNFIMFDTLKYTNSLAFVEWFKEQVNMNSAIWVGNGITEAYQLKLTNTTPEMRENIGTGFGYSVHKGKAKLIKLLSSVTSSLEEDFNE